jgi:glutamyl-tRNA synthetase
MKVRTRFAPSPTGYLHIGGVRTALFCYLFAKKHGGQFILRIDDTDQQRNVEEALQPILDGLHWLGINWDEGPTVNDSCGGGPHAPYYQSQRSDKYQVAVEELLKRGLAYRDFAKPEEIQAERDAAVADKRTFTYSRRWMAQSDADVKRFEEEGRQGVVRLKMPREGTLVINDLIRGQVEFGWADEQDHVIQRADGSFIYHLANVVDDEDFEISHVIRAEEHLSNTPRQIFMIQSLGYKLPEYAHLPFVAEPGSKTKLSKRKLDKYLKNKDFAKLFEHGISIMRRLGVQATASDFNPVIVDFYKKVGYLPEAIVNALAMLGWALDDKTEFFLMDDLVKHFSLEGVTKGAASFDPQKLFAFQEKHMLAKTVEEKVKLCEPFLDGFFNERKTP